MCVFNNQALTLSSSFFGTNADSAKVKRLFNLIEQEIQSFISEFESSHKK
jgi:NRPS condensation-like uncharacterized protein